MPLDYVCVKSGVLCPRCEGLIESGSVDEREVEVMKALIELEEGEGLQALKKATYYKAYFIDDEMVIVVMDLGVGASVPVFTRYARDIEQKLRDKLGKRVKIIPRANDVRGLATHLLYPIRILGVNTLWLPDGSIEYVVRIPRRDERRLGKSKEVYERILSELLGKRTRIKSGY
ncbi:transcription elongation factor [Pyrodictium delaneyi]|uniref:Transcription elongation factor n=2 Tax=Pyrodictium delaneyi TaxID=1273541 RepID=A0A211YPK2_9CREN|nr:transcription elongation factor [Pyrodictium delaneyi]